MVQLLWKTACSFYKAEHIFTARSSSHAAKYSSNQLKTRFIRNQEGKHLQYSTFIHNGPKWEQTPKSFGSKWINYGTSWRGKWQPTPVFLPGESRGQRSLVGCCPWGRTGSHTIEVTQQQQHDTSIPWMRLSDETDGHTHSYPRAPGWCLMSQCERQLVIMYQQSFISYNKCITVVQVVNLNVWEFGGMICTSRSILQT